MNLFSIIRTTPIGIGNSVRYLKKQIGQAEVVTGQELRPKLLAAIDQFIEDKIVAAFEYIAKSTADTIIDGDVVLTYGWSPVICEALISADKEGKKFKVIVIDSAPNFYGRKLVEKIGHLDVRYVLISGLSYVMPEAKKVLIEPCGILSNNAAQTPVGTAMISMVAHECGVPVIFACAAYRFVTDVRIDALSKNDIIGRDLLSPIPRDDIQMDPQYLALMYDVTPGQYVNVVISELGNIPVNSISTNMRYIQESYLIYSKPRVPPQSS